MPSFTGEQIRVLCHAHPHISAQESSQFFIHFTLKGGKGCELQISPLLLKRSSPCVNFTECNTTFDINHLTWEFDGTVGAHCFLYIQEYTMCALIQVSKCPICSHPHSLFLTTKPSFIPSLGNVDQYQFSEQDFGGVWGGERCVGVKRQEIIL